ncbi:MAG: nickel-dependent hydrogenase large subunit [Rhodocyclales bacterium]|nr:nickel-dependent hydrogenase large subunit [Rhodocyclales bacterium]
MSGGIDPGCIRIRLRQDAGCISAVDVVSARPMVTSVLRGRLADEAVTLVPLLFALCGKAQGRAAELALAAARGAGSAPRLDPDIAAEAMREHLWRWLLDLPPLLGAAPLRDEFALAMGWMAQGEHGRLAAFLDQPRIDELWQGLDQVADLSEAASSSLPGIDAGASVRYWPRLDAEFCRLPQWQGRAAETGALARRGGQGEGAVFARRWRARLGELREWAQGLAKVGAGGTASSVPVAPGIGRGLVETARGLLMHEIVLDGERIADYFIVAPTEWNFHPQGPLHRWLTGRPVRDRAALEGFAARAVAALDPCVRWELAWL